MFAVLVWVMNDDGHEETGGPRRPATTANATSATANTRHHPVSDILNLSYLLKQSLAAFIITVYTLGTRSPRKQVPAQAVDFPANRHGKGLNLHPPVIVYDLYGHLKVICVKFTTCTQANASRKLEAAFGRCLTSF